MPKAGRPARRLRRLRSIGRKARVSAVVHSSPFFDKTYDEALSLLVEARNYFAYREQEDVRPLPPEARLLVSQETMRVTSRLTQVMAWLFCQRAVQNGEVSPEWALSEEFALGARDVCTDDSWSADERLPVAVRSLLDRSLQLYTRVGRLDSMMREQAAEAR
jgi:regulator of CtrA degradation